MNKIMNENWKTWYKILKAVEPEAYHKAIQYAEALALKNNLPTELAAEVEISHVMLACELLGTRP